MTFSAMFGLKWFIPLLSEFLHLSPAALYGRQRELVRAKLLAQAKGSGPGSGVRLSPDAVAMLLIAVLATDNVSDVKDEAPIFAGLKRANQKSGRPAETFRQFVAGSLSHDNDDDTEMDHIIVNRTARVVTVMPKAKDYIYFTETGKLPADETGFLVRAEFLGVISEVRRLLKQAEKADAARRALNQQRDKLQAKIEKNKGR
jgi:hypothetical protein